MRPAEPLRLTALEIASGYVFGQAEVDLPPGPHRPVEALERAILPALERPPCLVAFSGGVDSSAVLSLAAAVARRTGLAPPIPFTNRFPDAPATDESVWQERVVAALGLGDWVRMSFTDELDAVGPRAQRLLRRHGVLWPPNVHFLTPALEAARGGSVLTGVGGDQVLEPSYRLHRHAALMGGKVWPRPRDTLRLAYAAAPAGVRGLLLRRRYPQPVPCPWLTEHGRRAVARAWADEARTEPVRRGPHARWSWRSRGLHVAVAGMKAAADDHDALIVHPLADGAFVGALAGMLRRRGGIGRLHALREIAGHVIPEVVFERRTKAVFDAAFWNVHAEALARDVRAAEVDRELVDIEALRSFWREPEVSRFRTLTLLQAICAARLELGATSEQLVDDGGHRSEPPGSAQDEAGQRREAE